MLRIFAKQYRVAFVLLAVLMPFAWSGQGWAACLKNGVDRTVYVMLQSAESTKSGNLRVGATFCVPTKRGRKAVAKIFPYGGARFGCKSEIVGDETSVLVRFGTLNNCDFVPGP